MRIFWGFLFILFLSFNWASAGAPEICGSSRLTQALQYVQWHEKNIGYNQQARMAALEDSTRIQSLARATAWSSSLLFLLCISFLAAAITYRALSNRDLALALGVVYFAFFSFVLISSGEPIQIVTEEFRVEANTIHTSEMPQEIPGPETLREVLTSLSREQHRVPEVFSEMSLYLPREGRWWTLGWDDVNMINFQNEAYRALIRKGNFGLRTISTIREELQSKCRESGIQI